MARTSRLDYFSLLLMYCFIGSLALHATLHAAADLGEYVGPLYPSYAFTFHVTLVAYGMLVLAAGAFLARRRASAFFHLVHAAWISFTYAVGLLIGAQWAVPDSVAMAGAIAPWIPITVALMFAESSPPRRAPVAAGKAARRGKGR